MTKSLVFPRCWLLVMASTLGFACGDGEKGNDAALVVPDAGRPDVGALDLAVPVDGAKPSVDVAMALDVSQVDAPLGTDLNAAMDTATLDGSSVDGGHPVDAENPVDGGLIDGGGTLATIVVAATGGTPGYPCTIATPTR